MKQDIVNGIFELGGALVSSLHVRRIVVDKSVSGVSWIAVLFFTAWGYWNVYYYPAIEQPFSGSCAVVLAMMNTVYLAMLIRYDRRKK